MSSSNTPSLLQIPSQGQYAADHQISLLDRSASPVLTPVSENHGVELAHSAEPGHSLPRTASAPSLYTRLTDNSLTLSESVRREVAKQKYARYGQDRYGTSGSDLALATSSAGQTPGAVTPDANLQQRYFERAQARAKSYLQKKKTMGQRRDEADQVVDILYENQRGIFFFGIPKYSSNSLLPTDPAPWQNGQFRTSAVDIRNAQVPDPSWEWAWKSWYVDMSRDVDEEGWEYSFAFVGHGGSAFAWHGNHPWFHSFVRRRRWLRMRRRCAHAIHHTSNKAHEMTNDYFTIHAKTLRPESLLSSQARSGGFVPLVRPDEAEFNIADMEISTIGDLLHALRIASVDREKLLAINKFVAESKDELGYLGARIEDVMGSLLFQSSRRELLSDLVGHLEKLYAQVEKSGTAHFDSEKPSKGKEAADNEAQRIPARAQMLLDAIRAAETQVKQLEYWSDVKQVSAGSEAADPDADEEQQHIVPSFSNKQDAEEGTPELHKHPEHGTRQDNRPAPRKKSSSVWYEAQTVRRDSSDDNSLERYTTAPESASEIDRNKKTKTKPKPKREKSLLRLDGVAESADDP